MPHYGLDGTVLLSSLRKELRGLEGLTAREREIMLVLGQPHSRYEICEQLNISIRTLETHISSIYAKLGIGSRAELMAIYLELERRIGKLAMQAALDGPASSGVLTAPNTAAAPQKPDTGFMSPEQVDDPDGYHLKPDPLTAHSLSELEELLRMLWIWAGRPSARRLASGSDGAFSHATVSKLIYNNPGKPELKLRYVLGFVRACGAGKDEQTRWVTAWRTLTGRAGSASTPSSQESLEPSGPDPMQPDLAEASNDLQ